MVTAETVEHLHHAMTYDFQLLIVLTCVQIALIVWFIVMRRR